MEMKGFLAEIEFAVTVSLDAVWKERERLEEVQAKVEELTRTAAHEYARAEAIAMNAEDTDDVMLATGVHWDTYFGPDKERHESSLQVAELEELVSVRAFSCAAQSGSVLQYAKQGISCVHAGLSACPDGRNVGSQSLKDVIWQGRNQAMHWEEDELKSAVQSCFETLANDFGPTFAEFSSAYLAFEVVNVLGWRHYAAFEADMLLLA